MATSKREAHDHCTRLGGACLSRPPKQNGSSSGAQRTRQARPSKARRGTVVMPDEAGWMIKRNATDLTSRSLQRVFPFLRQIRRQGERARPHPCRHIGRDVILKFRLIRPSFEQHSENLVEYLEITLLLRDGSHLWAQRKLVRDVEKLAARSAGCGPRFGIARSDMIAFLDENGWVFLCADRRD